MGIFEEGMIVLANEGVLEVIVPFILVFVIVFAILQKTKILGEDKEGNPRKNFNAVVGLVMGLAVVIPHVIGSYPANGDIVTIINNALPNVSVILVAVVMLLLIIGVFGGGVNVAGSSLAGWAVLFSIIAVLVIFAGAANWIILPRFLWFLYDIVTQSLVIFVLVFALLIWFVTKDDKPKKDKAKEPGWLEKLGKAMESPKK